MKTLIHATLLTIALSATSVWATTLDANSMIAGPGVVPTAIDPEPVSDETLSVANMLISRPVQNCLSQFERMYRADVLITSIEKTSTDYGSFKIKAVALLGGDAVVGVGIINVKRSTGIFWSTHYECSVYAPESFEDPM